MTQNQIKSRLARHEAAYRARLDRVRLVVDIAAGVALVAAWALVMLKF